MKRIFTLMLFVSSGLYLQGQVFIDEFDDDVVNEGAVAAGYTTSEADGEWTIVGDGSAGPWDVFTYTLPSTIDISENGKIFIKAKASNLGTQLRMDVKDADGYLTTLPGVSVSLVADYGSYELDYNGQQDGGYGGSPCDDTTAPCDVDLTRVVELIFFINPGQGNFGGTVVLDYISVGVQPDGVIASNVWQDHFDDAGSLGYMNSNSPGLVNSIENSIYTITGDGTNETWTNTNILMHNLATQDTIDVSFAEGNDKLYVRMRSDVPDTRIRIDIQDINDMASTEASATKLISDEWKTYEYNFAGLYNDLGYGGTGCSSDQAPCPLDPERIANFIFFVNPGAEAFAGTVQIEYLSVGTSLEAGTGEEGVVVYGDHFSTDYGTQNTTTALELSVQNSNLKIQGFGGDPPYAGVYYGFHAKDSGEQVYVDATGNNKVYVRAKSTVDNTLLRLDVQDSLDYTSTIQSATRSLGTEYAVLEYDFSGGYSDGGYGGSPCDDTTAPCPVDATALRSAFLYPNPADGGFEGCIEIDYISFGAPLGDDVKLFSDHFANDDRSLFSDAGGFTVEETGTELIVTGDGTAGAYAAFNYTTHDTETGAPIVVDLTSNNKLFVKAKSTVAGTPLRIDLVDEGGFATTEPATIATVNEEYEILEFDFTGTYMDGGYGGTACDMGPCPVDGSTINSMLFYIDPNNGGYAGTMTIDWISTIEPLEEIVDTGGPLGIDDYKDAMNDNSLDFIEGMPGLTAVAEDGLLKVIGDGTSGEWGPVVYQLHEAADAVIVNAESNNGKLYIRAKSTVDGMPLRVDLQDNEGYVTSLAGLTQAMTSDFQIYEYDFAGTYQDGGYGGTPCTAGPCPVDRNRIQQLLMFLDPGIGLFNGEFHIDWITFGEPFEVSVIDHSNLTSAMVFPNPTSEIVHLEMNTKAGGAITTKIINANGQLLSSDNLGYHSAGATTSALDVSTLLPGMYILHVSIEGQPAFYSKLIIE